MLKLRFTGRVLPAVRKLSLPSRPTFNWKVDHLGLEVTFRMRIEGGSVQIDCDANKFDAAAHLLPLFVRAYDIASASVDLAAFATGNGLTVVLDTLNDSDGREIPLATHQDSLAALATAVKLDSKDFDTIVQMVLAQPSLLMALSDLIDAVLLPHRAAFNCARAIGNLGPYFKGSSSSPDAGWVAARENLQIAKSYLQRITQPSSLVGSRDSADITRSAWVVMNRLFEYLKRGQPLPLSEFPLLT